MMRVQKYLLQLIGETTHSIENSRVGSENVKEKLDKIIAEPKNRFAERTNGGKKIKARKGSKGTRTVLSLPGGI